MRDYHGGRREREPLVREIYGLGFSPQEIAEITKWSEATIVQDIRRLGGKKAFPNRPKHKCDVFAAVIRRYAQIMIVFTNNEWKVAEGEDAVRQALATWLREDLIHTMLRGLQIMLDQLTVPSFPPERHHHARLLGVILGVAVRDPCNTESWPLTATEHWWHEMLAAIRSGKEPPPHSHWHLGQMIVRRMLTQRRAQIMPIWDESVFTILDDLLKSLYEDERKLICERFGINVPKARTMEQIALDWKYSRTINRFRVQVKKHQLGVLGDPVGNALQYELGRRKAREEVVRVDPHGQSPWSRTSLCSVVQAGAESKIQLRLT
ncbi:hypothetical protein EPN81_02395 [Patescibacteria group bacterium]|nr:MAG: hypothetical protein EPN81_02395 [Patescibacteria group bacterium]